MPGVTKFTDEMKAKMAEMYMQGHTKLQIAEEFDCSLNTVQRAIKGLDRIDRRGESANKAKLTDQEKKDIVAAYKSGTRVEDIAKSVNKYPSSVRDVLRKAGVLKHKHDVTNINVGYGESAAIRHNRIGEAVLTCDIDNIRRRTKVGDEIMVRTCKFWDPDHQSSSTMTKRATVIDADHPRFVQVRLNGNGLTEAFLWSDLVIDERRRIENNEQPINII